MKSWIGIGGLVAAIALTGCGDGNQGSSGGAAPAGGGAAPAGGGAKKEEVSGDPGSIAGKVTYKNPPKLGTIDMSKDANCAKKHATPMAEEYFLAGEGGTLGNVVVEIARGPKAWKAAPGPVETKTMVLDQVGCAYVPHVFALRAGTPFEVKNSDETDHNIHFYGDANKTGAKDNVAQPKGAANLKWSLANAEENPVYFKCDVHPWMQSFGRVLDHNYFTVTSKTGAFEFKNLPPGEYTMQAWHESFSAPVKKKVTVPAGGSVEFNPVFDFDNR
jgi:plastocyanin